MTRKKNDLISPLYDTKNKTISFQRFVLDALEKRARDNNMKVSTLVNRVIKSVVVTDPDFYRMLARHYSGELNKAEYMISELEAKAEIKG